MKTLIELFDESQLENVIAGLRLLPQRIIFVGYKHMMTPKRITDLENLFKGRGLKTEFSYEIVGRYDYDSIYGKLLYLAENNPDCAFDLTGGKELILAAIGAVAKEKDVPLVQFEPMTGKFVRVKGCKDIPEPGEVALDFKELVMLNGGAIIEKEPGEFEWELTEDFKSDLQKLWNICRADCAAWNRQTNVLAGFEEENPYSGSLRVNARKQRVSIDDEFMKKLCKSGLISDYGTKGDNVYFRYKNDSVRRALIKAGNILELYAYMLLNEINSEENGCYDDILTGVAVDWDGIIYKRFRYPADTHNELDIVVMRNLVPVFVSCKNGEVHKEALYELNTVAEKFGGKYAKKALISTYVSFNEKGKKHLESRARDMNIELIHGVNNLTREEFKNVLKNKLR